MADTIGIRAVVAKCPRCKAFGAVYSSGGIYGDTFWCPTCGAMGLDRSGFWCDDSTTIDIVDESPKG